MRRAKKIGNEEKVDGARQQKIMAKNTSVTLGDHFEKIIERSIKSGRYSSASEVIRAGLRMVDEREQKIRLLREAVEAGEKSGYIEDFDPVKHLETLKKGRASK